MVDPKELRIGNWVKNSEMVGTIKNISTRTNAYDLDPIPLTPKVFYKCGFSDDIDRDASDMIIGNFRIFAGHHEWWFWGTQSPPDDTNGRISVRLDYLHQLQNLYFALTGEELNYQP